MALNPGLLAQIGRGLSLGGGVLNADIFAQQQQERAQAKLNAEQRRAALAQFIVQAAQGGIMSPEDAQAALRAAAPEMAESLKGALGPSLEVQRSALKFQQDQQDRADRAAWLEGQGLPQGIPDSVVSSLFKAQTTQDKAASALGKLADDFRNGRITREEYEAGKRKALYIAPQSQSGQSQFGTGLVGRAYETVAQVEGLRQSGQPIPQDLAIQYRVAQHILQQPQLRAGQNGELVAYTPGLPEFGQQPVQSGEATQNRGNVSVIRAKETSGSINQALSALNDVATILNEADAEGETVTGVVGTAKRYGGGLARQAGIPVSPRAERLTRSLERLKALVGPDILKDSRLSDAERKRVEQIVGDVNVQTDDVALRESLSDLAKILSRISAPQSDGASGQQRRVVVDY